MEDARGRRLDLDGPTWYLDLGGPPDAPLVVFLHGLGGSHLNWAPLAPLLAPHVRMLAVDLPAHGRTPAAGRSCHVRDVQLLVHRFLGAVAAGPAILVGNSMGATVAVLQVGHDRTRVSGLVLIDPVLPQTLLDHPNPVVLAAFATYGIPWTSRLVARVRGRMTVQEVTDQILQFCTAHPERVPRDLIDTSIDLARARDRLPGAADGFTQAARSLVTMLARPRRYRAMLAALDVPVLLLHGAKDRLVPVRAAQRATAVLDWLRGPGRSAAQAASVTTRPR
jgi:pimeloyl-ACP methyl ester carboxylesterase